MKTSRPIATITYNTDKFLNQVLNDLLKRDVISFWCWVEHFPEEDELKKHKHLYIVPNGQTETNGIRKLLEEVDLSNPLGKPLGCLDFRNSKFDDWYLYGIHDSAYLASKGQARKHHYQEKDIQTNCVDSLHERVCTIDFSKYRKTQDFVDAIIRGVSFYDMVKAGQVPAPQFIQWKQLYEYIYAGMVERNERETHTPNINQETGEILD